MLTAGQMSDIASAADLITELPEGAMLLADKGYDANDLRNAVTERKAWANIPPKANRRDPICFSPFLYKARNLVERFFNKAKQFRRIATRYDKLAENYLAALKQSASGYAVMSLRPRSPMWRIPSSPAALNQSETRLGVRNLFMLHFNQSPSPNGYRNGRCCFVLARRVTMNMTYKAVQRVLRKAGIVISKKGEVHRINFFSGLENTAYYTTSLQEALDRGLAMARGAGRLQASAVAKSAETGRPTSARVG